MAASDIFRQMRGTQNFSLPPRPGKPAAASVTEIEVATTPTEPEAPEDDEETAKLGAGYVAPDQHCASCAHCDEASRCSLYGFTCDPEGGCPDHEVKADGTVPSQGEEPEPFAAE